MTGSKWAVGQEVFVVMTNRRAVDTRPAKIAKVGRKWITLDGAYRRPCRFDPDTGMIDGGEYMSPGAVYASQEEYELEVQANAAWRKLVWTLGHNNRPAHMTAEAIAELTSRIEGHAALNPAEPT